MLEIQITSAWDEEFWLKKEQLEQLYSVSYSTPYVYQNITFF